MDELKKGLKNISLYDVKSYVRKAQNVMYNYTEMESRVREATNNEPWGASTTSMAKIAAGTYNFREREEIIGMIFRRFTEKSSNEWRQIYKALQLLEYLVKNGSERFVDDTRANLSLVTMLRSFHYIDSQGRDQGINVRTKAKSLVALLNDDATLRAERKKARDNTKKFQGVAGGAAVSSNGRAGNEMGDYDDYDTYDNRIFGDGGVYGQRFEESRNTGATNKTQFEEYDVEESAKPRQSNSRVASSSKPVPSKPVDVDLFSFGDDTPAAATSAAKADDDFDDDFGDFQGSASNTQAQNGLNNLSSLYNNTNTQAPAPAQDNLFGDFTSFNSSTTTTTNTTTYPQQSSFSMGPASSTKQDAFSSLFNTASTKAHKDNLSQSSSTSVNAGKSNTKSSYEDNEANPFGSFSQPSATTASSSSNKQQQSSSNNAEVSLLDL
ncbi:hypothetical protein WICPIJ_001912 [Wickerhamomyces pijperi]|uniref:ENTH domain-containing protein n=1 Tax=Wickerhamomyces pijperi TaxID=599730 RepID=A0A9P8TQA7_WICPI|nr:hypothetical protein WICPIJ_001912 [Wickerhamomyces pijperi]